MSNGGVEPSLFGLTGRSSRDFSREENWGKNQFNNAFPASLLCYMSEAEREPVYLQLAENMTVFHDKISVQDLFGAEAFSPSLFFAFEAQYSPYLPLVSGNLPRVDLVTIDRNKPDGGFLQGLEVKLTALPDNQTAGRSDADMGCELVVRPDTIIYAALSIAQAFDDAQEELLDLMSLDQFGEIDWESERAVRPLIPDLADALDRALAYGIDRQSTLLLQPVWKTLGKLLKLHENCFDVFVWSDFALTRLFVDRAREQRYEYISRDMRSIVWLVKMLEEYGKTGQVNPQRIVSRMNYAKQTDKAFAIGGALTNRYMRSPELASPRVHRTAVKEIIRGGGEKYLSPERRLDAVIQSTFEQI